MNQQRNIRPAVTDELPQILELYRQARRFMAENGNPHQWGDRYPYESILREDIAARRLYVCTDAGELAAVFCFTVGEDPDYRKIYDGNWLNEAPYGVVHRIAVRTKGRGVASACLNYAFSRCGNLRIDTHRDNLPMQRTLAKNGFAYCGVIHCRHGSQRIAYQKIQ